MLRYQPVEPTGAVSLPFEECNSSHLEESLRRFQWHGRSTVVTDIDISTETSGQIRISRFTNEFWTAKQRAAHSLHEISYRACFKPQLPRFFIERLTVPGNTVYDPFMGRGTTLLEAALMGRRPYGCDVNPLSRVLCEPRLRPPSLPQIERALAAVDFADAGDTPEELLVFYHPDTLRQISALRKHLLRRAHAGGSTAVDRWIQMVAVNRLTGHSPGFFSVYTMPPNQAVSARVQAKINAKRNQQPPLRDVRAIILAKSRSMLRDVTQGIRAQLEHLAESACLVTGVSSDTPSIDADSVDLVVTSPPFLDVVDYKSDNWLRCWFAGIDVVAVPVTVAKQLDTWKAFVKGTLTELRRVLRPGGYVAFEVGEVKGGALRLDDVVIPAGEAAGLEPVLGTRQRPTVYEDRELLGSVEQQ